MTNEDTPRPKAFGPFGAGAQDAGEDPAQMNKVRFTPPPTAGMTFTELSSTNLQRTQRWHHGGLAEWSVNDWLVALGGEAGEALNEGKKLRRIECAISQHGDAPEDIRQAHERIMDEIADVVIYADLIATRLGYRLEDAIVRKFNATSVREGFPERLMRKDGL